MGTGKGTLLRLISNAYSPTGTLLQVLSYGYSPTGTLLWVLSFGHSPTGTLLRVLSYGYSPTSTILRALSYGYSPTSTLLRALSYGYPLTGILLRVLSYGHSPLDALHVTKGVMYLPITKNTVTSFLRAKSPPLPHHYTIHKTNHGSYRPHPFNRVLLLIGFNKSIVQICARKYEKNINNDSICWPPKQTSNRLIQKIKAHIYYLIRSLLILYCILLNLV